MYHHSNPFLSNIQQKSTLSVTQGCIANIAKWQSSFQSTLSVPQGCIANIPKWQIFISEYLISSTKLHCKHCKVTISIPILALTDWAEEANWFWVSGEQVKESNATLSTQHPKCIWSSCKPIKPLRSPSQMCVMKANFVAKFFLTLFFFGTYYVLPFKVQQSGE
jgi:hypothetical protein